MNMSGKRAALGSTNDTCDHQPGKGADVILRRFNGHAAPSNSPQREIRDLDVSRNRSGNKKEANMRVLVLVALAALAAAKRADIQNMNGLYEISNPNVDSTAQFSTDYSTKDAEYFDVYTPPITSRYGEVYWTLMKPSPIPADIVQRFRNKTMAIIGYETDQVMQTKDGDVSVPITWAYNHHYVAHMTGEKSTLVEADARTYAGGRFANIYQGKKFYAPADVDGEENVAPPPAGIPTAQLFSEGNGGEFRKSFHGYPTGYAQLIYSPDTFYITPMQIDTHNRDHPGPGFVPGPLPKAAQSPPNASYSGILECPCTDRIKKDIHSVYTALMKGACSTPAQNASECFAAATSIGTPSNATTQTVSDKKLPSGCSVVRSPEDTVAKVFFNTEAHGTSCGGGSLYSGQASALKQVSMHFDLNAHADEAKITLTGPDGVWFGVGINASAMADLPYTIIVNGSGEVMERKLANHDAGAQITTSVTVLLNTVVNGVRTIVLNRTMKGMTADHYTFSPAVESSIPFISAVGSGPAFAYHKFKGAATLSLTALDGATCVCNVGVKGSINGIPFNKDCWDEPKGDLVQQKNPTCWVDTYAGGLHCCHHGWILLDQDQNPWENQTMEYHLKFRFWFQEYNPEEPKHENLVRIFWETEVWSTEYDIPVKEPSVMPENALHEIQSHWKVGDMLHDCSPGKAFDCTGSRENKTGINLIYAGGHCHAPSCYTMELWNADNGQLLCRHDPIYGNGTEIFNEDGYLALPPCLWGSKDEGLIEPIFLSFDTNLVSVKRNNNTYGHYGEMALWQMRGVLV